MLGPQKANGDYLSYTDVSYDNNELYQPPIYDPYNCCVACITSDNNCGYSIYSYGQGYCLLIEGMPTCNNPGYVAGTFYETTASNAFDTVYSNGLCGVVQDGGVVSS